MVVSKESKGAIMSGEREQWEDGGIFRVLYIAQ
jgi:hypothetical protein